MQEFPGTDPAASLLEPEQLLKLNEYEQDLAVFSNEKNKIKRDALLKAVIEKYRSFLGFSQSDIISHAALLSLPENEEERKIYDLQALLDLQTSIPNWLVPNLIAGGGGLYMVAGSPKAGKTRIFAYQLAFSIMFSGEFLGFPCAKGPVLIFQCEEAPAKVARTFRSKGLSSFNDQVEEIRRQNPHLLRVETDFAIDADLSYLKQVVREFKPSLVIYDSLRAITKHLGVSENSSDISKYVYVLQKVHNYLETPGLIIHHMSKGGKERGLEGVAGSLSLAGATDGVFRLYKDGSKEKANAMHPVELITDPREGLPIHWKIELTRPKNSYWSYKITEDVGVNPEQHRIERRILRWLCNTPNILFSRGEIAAGLDLDRAATPFDYAIDRLVDSLQIAEEQTADGFRLWINQTSPWASLTHTNSPLTDDFGAADQLSSATTKSEIDTMTETWTQDYKIKIFSLLSPKEQLRVAELLHSSQFNIGDWVISSDKNGEETTHKIENKIFDGNTKAWIYVVEGKKEFQESDLRLNPDYATTNYSKEL